ncbi:MAG: hypothetical protein ACAH59_01295 [Pseudobdellovibrionaceae bacterium]
MAEKAKLKESSTVFLATPREYFSEVVEAGLAKRNIRESPAVRDYLIGLLEHYLDAKNLYGKPDTLAEAFLIASNSQLSEKVDLLKKLGDKSLYISGFFGDSLSRKLVDVDYYAGMGGAAYSSLADCLREDAVSQVYRVFSHRFIEFVDVLTYISQQSFVQTDQGLLQLYDRYMRTGSELAKEKLIEMGVLTLPQDQAKLTRQD